MFYKLINNTLHYGPTVQFPTGDYLSIDTMDQYTLPFDGWYYFETIEEANTYFNITEE